MSKDNETKQDQQISNPELKTFEEWQDFFLEEKRVKKITYQEFLYQLGAYQRTKGIL